MAKKRIGIVTAWGECGMGYIAKNWTYTLDKYNDKIEYQIYSRSFPWLTPFRWHGPKVINGPETMEINHSHFWEWVDSFKPDVILFQDQNIYGESNMYDETQKLKKIGVKLINYPDWIMRGDIDKYKGLYHVNLSHVKRNYNWLLDAKVESPTYIPWGVIIKHFPFFERRVGDKIKFYINIGTGTLRKGYQFIPNTLDKMKGRNIINRLMQPQFYNYSFIATSIKNSEHRIDKKFLNYFQKHENCQLFFKTADNRSGGLFNLGDVYIYPTTKEGVGLTITEAMCTGMPVVTSNYPTMNEWIDDNVQGKLINIAKIKKGSMPMNKVTIDTQHLAEIMIDYIKYPDKVFEHSINARKKVEKKYNWEHRDKKILSLFDLD